MQHSVWWDDAVNANVTVTEMRASVEAPATTNRHALDAVVECSNHVSGAERERVVVEGLGDIATVEHQVVRNRHGVAASGNASNSSSFRVEFDAGAHWID